MVGAATELNTVDNTTHTSAFKHTYSEGVNLLGDLAGGDVHSYASAISANGKVIIGSSYSSNGLEAFRHTQSTGIQGLGALPGSQFKSSANGISNDGKVIIGNSIGINGSEGFRYSTDTGIKGIGGLGNVSGGTHTVSRAKKISGNGKVIMGQAYGANGLEAFRYTETNGIVGLGDLPGKRFISIANDISDEGLIVGSSESFESVEFFSTGGVPFVGSHAFKYTESEGMIGIPNDINRSSGLDTRAVAISDDGSTIIVTSTGPRSGALRILSDGSDESLNLTSLDIIRGSNPLNPIRYVRTVGRDPKAISDDGNFIAGSAVYDEFVGTGVYNFHNRAHIWLWDENGQYSSNLFDKLLADGFDLTGWSYLNGVDLMSGDGSTIVGYGFFNGKHTQFVARASSLSTVPIPASIWFMGSSILFLLSMNKVARPH